MLRMQQHKNLSMYSTQNMFSKVAQRRLGTITFFTRSLKAKERVGPHNQEIIDILVGSLLGDSWGEKRSNSTRFHLHMQSRNVEYLEFLRNSFLKNGYCSDLKPKKSVQIGKDGKRYFSIKIRTFSFISFNEIYDMFYLENKKIVPKKIAKYLTPRALAVWIMDDGGKSGVGRKISTESFTLEEVTLLKNALLSNFGLEYRIQAHKQCHILYLPKAQLNRLAEIVQDFVVPSMRYKIISD